MCALPPPIVWVVCEYECAYLKAMASQYMVWLNSLHSFGAVVKYWMHLSCQDSNSNNACLGLLNWKLIIDCRTRHCLIQGLMHSSFAQSKSSSDFRCPCPCPARCPLERSHPCHLWHHCCRQPCWHCPTQMFSSKP